MPMIGSLECGDLSPLWSERRKESGDKSPHSIWARTFNCTRVQKWERFLLITGHELARIKTVQSLRES